MHTKHRTLPRNIFLRAVMIAGLALAVAFAVSPARAYADDAPVTEGVPYRIVSFPNPSLVAQFDAAAPAVGEAATCAVPNGTSGQVFTFAKTASGA